MSNLLEIKNLHAEVEGKQILKGLNLTINKGEIHAIMGPNGSGKSTLSYVLMGHPSYEVTEGEILFNGENIVEMETDERAALGLFLAFQYPHQISGVTLFNFMRSSLNSLEKKRTGIDPQKDKKLSSKSVLQFSKKLSAKMKELGIDESFQKRYVNEGFSGGEKKRAEILQMAMLEPTLAILDETDSGLDIDALKIVSDGVNRLASPERSALVITHYQRLLNYIKPDFVHVLWNGKIILSGGPTLALDLEDKGYDWVKEEYSERIAA
ncbi:MAG: Fe-S cluster assembly ATPase SufC [Ignavibacteriales bacterium]|nr:Fe-S cluster assembly ATPase SufC [Ignavibacteriales bacterium]